MKGGISVLMELLCFPDSDSDVAAAFAADAGHGAWPACPLPAVSPFVVRSARGDVVGGRVLASPARPGGELGERDD